MTKLSDFIFYGVKLKVKSIENLTTNKIRVVLKSASKEKELSMLKDVNLVYVGNKSNGGLFGFLFEKNSVIQSYALTLKKGKVGDNTFQTQRLFIEKPGRK